MPAAPEANKKLAGDSLPTDKPLSRYKQRIASGQAVILPPIIDEVAYIVHSLFEAGPVSTTGMGSIPITWADLAAWQQGTGISLQPWELRLIRDLSAHYLSEGQLAEKHDCPAPWQAEIDEEEQKDVSKKVQNAFQMLMSTRPKNN